MERVKILQKETIFIGRKISTNIAEDLLENVNSSHYVIITDDNVEPAACESIRIELQRVIGEKKSDSRVQHFVIPAGECSKSHSQKQAIEAWMFKNDCRRDTVVIAVGGGVVGDLTGYLAATYMRGLRFVQIPTSLLAMSDSSIGGKVGINTSFGKNLVGSFWQPKRIYIDVDFLSQLPAREFFNGFAEIIKIAAVFDKDLFTYLEDNANLIVKAIESYKTRSSSNIWKISRNLEDKFGCIILDIVRRAVEIKADVVTKDERETGLRSLLNFGHTLGHAYEKHLYPQVLHGECVAFGMIKESEIARHLGIMSHQSFSRLKTCLLTYNLPVRLQDLRGSKRLNVDIIFETLKIDKKATHLGKKFVLLKEIGFVFKPEAVLVDDNDINFILSPDVMLSSNSNSTSQFPEIKVPGSKSITNRAIILAALSRGECRLKNVLSSDDTQHLLLALKKVGIIEMHWEDRGETLKITGCTGKLGKINDTLYVGNAGTAARFLTTFFTLGETESCVVLSGNSRMKERPIGDLVDCLTENGSKIKYLDSKGCLPLEIRGGGFLGGMMQLKANVSSQFVSSLLLCAPYAKIPVKIVIDRCNTVSMPYITMTITMMKSFGIFVKLIYDDNKLIFEVPQGVYSCMKEYTIESDASSATYPLALAAILGVKCSVLNIGKNSIQGDSKFAEVVLTKMGCSVEIGDDAITVCGPSKGTLKSFGVMEMNDLTDAFMTSAILAACAQNGYDNISEIRGIANQRVKECNRISAMTNELQKFGVKVEEFEDGLRIYGKPIDELLCNAKINTYDDHRIAMSISVLASVIDGSTIVRDKACIEKTWAEWWDVVYQNFPEVSLQGTYSPELNLSDKDILYKSLVLVGMRGVGKSTLGGFLSNILCFDFVDIDIAIENKTGLSIAQIVDSKGWEAFRHLEQQCFAEVWEVSKNKCVIACGGGIVEKLENRKLLKDASLNGHMVIYIKRKTKDVLAYLSKQYSRPQLPDDLLDIWARRDFWFRECSNQDLYLTSQNYSLYKNICVWIKGLVHCSLKHDFFKIVRDETGIYCLQVTVSKILHKVEEFTQNLQGYTMIDILIDKEFLETKGKYKLSKLVSIFKSRQNILVTLSLDENCSEGVSVGILNDALRTGADYIKLSHTLAHHYFNRKNRLPFPELIIYANKRSSEVSWDSSFWLKVIEKYGYAFKYQFNLTAASYEIDLPNLLKFRSDMKHNNVVAQNRGTSELLSTALNKGLSVINYKSTSILELNNLKFQIGVLSPKRFFVFGRNITYSRSPRLHNAQFDFYGLKYSMELFDCNLVQDTLDILASDSFGGAAVTIPFKSKILNFLNSIDEDAREIGAVNTVLVRDGKLIGINTDWMAIYSEIMFSNKQLKIGLVIGCGGTSRSAIYALKKAGYSPIYLINRSAERANQFIDDFKSLDIYFITSLKEIESRPPTAVISTIPANQGIEEVLKTLVEEILTNFNGIFIDMAYEPVVTPFIKIAKKHEWLIFSGLNMLSRQAEYQFIFWTGLAPNIPLIKKTIENS